MTLDMKGVIKKGQIIVAVLGIILSGIMILFSEGVISQSNVDNILKCNGCLRGENCYPLGYTQEGIFCSQDKVFYLQLNTGSNCYKDYECISNSCNSNKCVENGLFNKIIGWFKKVLGFSRPEDNEFNDKNQSEPKFTPASDKVVDKLDNRNINSASGGGISSDNSSNDDINDSRAKIANIGTSTNSSGNINNLTNNISYNYSYPYYNMSYVYPNLSQYENTSNQSGNYTNNTNITSINPKRFDFDPNFWDWWGCTSDEWYCSVKVSDNVCPKSCGIRKCPMSGAVGTIKGDPSTDIDCCNALGGVMTWMGPSTPQCWRNTNFGNGSCSSKNMCEVNGDGCCPSWCMAGSDKDCCTQSGAYWFDGRCYTTPTVNPGIGNCTAENADCSSVVDGCCPNKCTSATDKDCCTRSGMIWTEGKGCSTLSDFGVGYCLPYSKCTATADSCCPYNCPAENDSDCCYRIPGKQWVNGVGCVAKNITIKPGVGNCTNSNSACSENFDGCCPTNCMAGNDNDCCRNKGYFWLAGRGCYDQPYYGIGLCTAANECESIGDGCCPQWCSLGADKDCCLNNNYVWVNQMGCYYKYGVGASCNENSECEVFGDGCCPSGCGTWNDKDCK